MPKTPLAQADRFPLSLADNSGFSGNLQRCLLGTALSPENNTSYQRLLKTLLHGASFQFILLEIRNELLRDQLIATLDQAAATAGLSAGRLDLGAEDPSFDLPELENRLLDLAKQHAIVHLCGYDHWLTKERWQALNIRRDTLAENCRVRLLWWLAPESIRLCAEQAPDLWSWRSGVYDFSQTAPLPLPEKAQFAGPIDNRSLHEGTRRIAQIRSWLRQNPADELRLPLLDELAGLLVRFGQLDEALSIRRDEEMPVYEKLGDVRSRALTLGYIADIHQARGELDEALRFRLEEQLPVFEKLGDARSRAVTLGKIADIHQARGQLDEALRIRIEEQLPVFEKLGDVHSRALTLGKIADIHQARGELDEALRIRLDEEIPVYEKLGDVRSRALTLGKIADILQERGQLDEALRIRIEEQLPVFEKLGDVRSRAMTLGKIADILQERGQLDEALRIRLEEQLPVFEKLGDVHSRAVTLGQIADIHQARGQLDEALRIRLDEEMPIYEKLGDVHSRAVTLGQIADIHQARGQLDEALRFRLEEQLPVFEKLGDVRSRAVTLGQIADIHQARGQFDEALRIRFEEQLPVFEKLGDVRSRAVTLGQIADIHQARGQLDEAQKLHEERLPVAVRLGDIGMQAHIHYSLASIILDREGLRADNFEKILEHLREAFAIVVRLQRPGGIGSIGYLLAQVLAAVGAKDEALQILAQADAAWTLLGDDEGRKTVATLHQLIVAMPERKAGQT